MTPLKRFLITASLLASFCIPALVCRGGETVATSVTNRPFDGVVCITETRVQPPQRLFIAQIDLTNPQVHLRVTAGGPDPDGPGAWQTTLMRPTEIASREQFDLVINGDFFEARGVKDAEGKMSPYREGLWARVIGPAMTDGHRWSAAVEPQPCLVVHTNHAVSIELRREPVGGDWEVVGGNRLLVHEGTPLAQTDQARHPRTAAGLDGAARTLTLLVVDGRKPGVATGMTYSELAAELRQLGCREALNLDGGGSSVLAVRDEKGEMRILNQPTDGHERAVANVLGISLEKPSKRIAVGDGSPSR